VTLSRRGLLAGGALLALPVAAQARERSDADTLGELLALENRLVTAYEAALRREVIDSSLGELLRDQEREHVRGVQQALDELGSGSPKASVPDAALGRALRGRRAFSAYALRLEGEVAAAYANAASGIGQVGLRRPLGSILACEAAHQVALRAAAGENLLSVE
jgi:hypothetical protein